jgi:hypothetical protein
LERLEIKKTLIKEKKKVKVRDNKEKEIINNLKL